MKIEALLSTAALDGDVATVACLLHDKSLHVNAKDRHETTPLMWAVLGGHVDVVRLFCDDARVDLNIRGPDVCIIYTLLSR